MLINMTNTRTQSGFSLIELMVALAVLAILVTVAAPSFRSMLLNNRMTSQINGFVTALQFARSEAVKRNATVSLCPKGTTLTCSGSNWENGWLIFADANGNGAFNSADDTAISVGEPLDGGATMRGSASVASSIRYDSTGAASNSGTFTVCDDRGSAHAHAIAVSGTGRPSTQTTATLSCS